MNRTKLLGVVVMLLTICICADAAYLVFQKGNLPLVSQKIKVSINNQVAVTSLEMVFDNPHDFTIQPNIRFPIHEKASVQSFSLTDSTGQTYSGTIEESSKATATFNEAKAEGLMPAMSVQKQPGVFETSIGAIGPKSRATVTIEYSEILPYSRGTVSYKLPFDVANWQQSNLDTVSIVADIIDQKEIVQIVSPSHDIYAEKTVEKNWRVVFEKNNFLPAGDFMLNYEVKAEKMAANFLTTRPDAEKDGYFLLMLSPAEMVAEADIADRDIVFVVDTSGSMSGQKMQQTKTAFEFFVSRLNANDRFGIVAFESKINPWKSELQKLTEENRQQARGFISALQTSGGTNINDSLQQALKMFDQQPNRTRTIIFLTDGEASTGITNSDAIVNNFNAANTLKVRTFTLGVGRSVNKSLLGKIAVENRGEAVYLDEASNSIDKDLIGFYQNISTPLLVDLELDFGGIEVVECYPKTLPNIYQGTQLVISGRYKKGGEAQIKLLGNLNSIKQEYPITAAFADNSKDNLFVSRFWAKAKADDLLLQMQTYGQKQEMKEQVIQLSKEYQFATPFTSFIAVSTTPVAQVQQSAAISGNAARNSAAMARVQLPTVNRTVVRQTQAKSISLWGATGFLPVAAIAIPNFRKAREQSRQKACFANMRVIQGAIEMYNMDNVPMLEVVTENELQVLVDLKYLKSLPVHPEEGCFYGTKGDVSKDGCIVCALHGSVEEPFIEGDSNFTGPTGTLLFYDPNTGGYVSHVTATDIQNIPTPWTTRIWNNYLADAVGLIINVPLFIIGLAFSLWLFYIILTIPFRVMGSIYSMFVVKEDPLDD